LSYFSNIWAGSASAPILSDPLNGLLGQFVWTGGGPVSYDATNGLHFNEFSLKGVTGTRTSGTALPSNTLSTFYVWAWEPSDGVTPADYWIIDRQATVTAVSSNGLILSQALGPLPTINQVMAARYSGLVDTANLASVVGTIFDDTYTANGVDLLYSHSAEGSDSVTGSAFNDFLYETARAGDRNTINGGLGFDNVHYMSGGYAPSGLEYTTGVVINGGLMGSGAGETLAGVEGIWGTDYADDIAVPEGNYPVDATSPYHTSTHGRGGSDTIVGNDQNNAIHGGAGADLIRGGEGWDYLVAGGLDGIDEPDTSGNILYGGGDSDELYGAFGMDILVGGEGNDVITDAGGGSFQISFDPSKSTTHMAGDTLSGSASGDDIFVVAGDSTIENARSSDKIFIRADGDPDDIAIFKDTEGYWTIIPIRASTTNDTEVSLDALQVIRIKADALGDYIPDVGKWPLIGWPKKTSSNNVYGEHALDIQKAVGSQLANVDFIEVKWVPMPAPGTRTYSLDDRQQKQALAFREGMRELFAEILGDGAQELGQFLIKHLPFIIEKAADAAAEVLYKFDFNMAISMAAKGHGLASKLAKFPPFKFVGVAIELGEVIGKIATGYYKTKPDSEFFKDCAKVVLALIDRDLAGVVVELGSDVLVAVMEVVNEEITIALDAEFRKAAEIIESPVADDIDNSGSGAAEPYVYYTGYGEDVVLDGKGPSKFYGGIWADTLPPQGNGNRVAATGKMRDDGNDTFDGGGGRDTLDFSPSAAAVTVDLAKSSAKGANIGTDKVLRMENVVGSGFGDKIIGSTAGNSLAGEAGADTVAGGGGSDTVTGGAGKDKLSGDKGNDVIEGNAGKDTLTGGAGADRFVFNAGLGASNADTIIDFKSGQDKLVLDDTIFAAVGTKLDKAEFYASDGAKAAKDSGDRIVYDSKSGKLYYDADGKDGAAAVHFATLGADPALTFKDFAIV
jgi:Ca2+-binding RTX toxin-like protein